MTDLTITLKPRISDDHVPRKIGHCRVAPPRGRQGVQIRAQRIQQIEVNFLKKKNKI